MGDGSLRVLGAGVVNDPANKSLRFDMLKFGLDRFCEEMKQAGAALKLTDQEPVLGRFFAESCSSQIIDDEAQRCKRIIQDLMDYSRPHATHLSQTKIQDLISKTLKLIENRLYKQKIRLTTEIASDLPRVHADYQQLEQVLVNLYLNAIDAMPRGGELAVSAQAHGSNGTGSVAIAVTDTGFGIDEETLARIFQPFYTAKKTRGLGLGLPICERIVKNHGGRIDVESQVGQGTTFKVIIPLTQGTA
jgi:signal transduction histidine kinase